MYWLRIMTIKHILYVNTAWRFGESFQPLSVGPIRQSNPSVQSVRHVHSQNWFEFASTNVVKLYTMLITANNKRVEFEIEWRLFYSLWVLPLNKDIYILFSSTKCYWTTTHNVYLHKTQILVIKFEIWWRHCYCS